MKIDDRNENIRTWSQQNNTTLITVLDWTLKRMALNSRIAALIQVRDQMQSFKKCTMTRNKRAYYSNMPNVIQNLSQKKIQYTKTPHVPHIQRRQEERRKSRGAIWRECHNLGEGKSREGHDEEPLDRRDATQCRGITRKVLPSTPV